MRGVCVDTHHHSWMQVRRQYCEAGSLFHLYKGSGLNGKCSTQWTILSAPRWFLKGDSLIFLSKQKALQESVYYIWEMIWD